MSRPFTAGQVVRAATAGALLTGASVATAQELEPRAYANAPVGMNFLIAGYGYTDGGLSFDPALPVKDPQLQTNNLLLAYARVLDLWGKSAKVDIIAPYAWLSGSARLGTETLTREVNGFYDPKVRLSVNLVGAPALTLKDYSGYKQDLIVGVSLQVSMPAGQYDPTRLVNIGMNRWTFKPEVGVSKALDRWTLEAAAGATFFTSNTDFYGGKTRAQDPLYSVQMHAIYSFGKGMWMALDATYYGGGQTTVSGMDSNDRQDNWRGGATFALPLNVRNSLKVTASNGVSARTGNNIFMAGVAWQYRWGGGL